MMRRVIALTLWVFGVWVLLTWTRTWSQLAFGLCISITIALVCAPLGEVIRPWTLLRPSRLLTTGALLFDALTRIVRANLSLAKRVWTPSLPLRSGMVIVPTIQHSEGALTAVGLITSLIVDNQIVDVDVEGREMQYHGVWIPSGEPEANFDRVNGPVERHISRLSRP
jgi:multicomponent Na+:H+ antiporter subunit E